MKNSTIAEFLIVVRKRPKESDFLEKEMSATLSSNSAKVSVEKQKQNDGGNNKDTIVSTPIWYKGLKSDLWEDLDSSNPKDVNSRGWVFTINNPTIEDAKSLMKLSDEKGFMYACWQLEEGKCGTPHFQGWLKCSGWRFKRAKRMISPRAWIAIKRGTDKQCNTYCTKEGRLGGPFTLGELKEREEKKATLLSKVAEMVQVGASDKDIATEEPMAFMSHYRKIGAYRDAISEPAVWDKNNVQIKKFENYEDMMKAAEGIYKDNESKRKSVYLKDNSKWWDGWDNHEIIVSEFKPESRWVRGYPFWGDTKGKRKLIRVLVWFYVEPSMKPIVEKKKKFSVNDPVAVRALIKRMEDDEKKNRYSQRKFYGDADNEDDVKANEAEWEDAGIGSDPEDLG